MAEYESIEFKCSRIRCPVYRKCCFLPTEYIKDKKGGVDLLFVGQGGGKEERLLGRPFVGRAGVRLRRLLIQVYKRIGRSFGVSFSNVIRDNPEDNRVPTDQEISECIGYLYSDIEYLRSKYGLKGIVLLGKAALYSFYRDIDNRKIIDRITDIRGKIDEVEIRGERYKTIVTYHPSYIIRNEPVFNEDNLGYLDGLFIEDISKIYNSIEMNKDIIQKKI